MAGVTTSVTATLSSLTKADDHNLTGPDRTPDKSFRVIIRPFSFSVGPVLKGLAVKHVGLVHCCRVAVIALWTSVVSALWPGVMSALQPSVVSAL